MPLQGADIFVAPEYGLTSLEMNESMALPVPAPSEGAVPCERDDGGVSERVVSVSGTMEG